MEKKSKFVLKLEYEGSEYNLFVYDTYEEAEEASNLISEEKDVLKYVFEIKMPNSDIEERIYIERLDYDKEIETVNSFKEFCDHCYAKENNFIEEEEFIKMAADNYGVDETEYIIKRNHLLKSDCILKPSKTEEKEKPNWLELDTSNHGFICERIKIMVDLTDHIKLFCMNCEEDMKVRTKIQKDSKRTYFEVMCSCDTWGSRKCWRKWRKI